MQIDVNLPEKLIPVFNGPARYRGAYGGRGGGKSIAFSDMAVVNVLQAFPKPVKFLCTRELQKSLKDSVFSLIEASVNNLNLQSEFDIGKEYIRCNNGNEFLFYGLRSNISEIKGLHGVQWCWNEEAQKTSKSSLEYLLPTIREPNSEIWFTYNPDDEQDPVHDFLVTNKPHNAKVAEINYIDNPWFPDVLEQERLRCLSHTPERYDWIWLGKFNINLDGSVYGKWVNTCEAKGRIIQGLYDPALPVHTAWDIGYSDYTTIWFFQVTGGEIRVIDYYENNREGIQHYASQLLGYEFIPDGVDKNGKISYKRGEPLEEEIYARRRSYRYGKHWVPHDAANKLFAANGRSIVEQANDLGLRMYVISAISQQNQITVARATIDQCWFDLEYTKEGVRSLRKYQFEFDDDKQRYKDKPLHDIHSHAADAFEILAQCQKMPIMEEAKEPPAFWQDLQAKEIFFPTNTGRVKRERI